MAIHNQVFQIYKERIKSLLKDVGDVFLSAQTAELLGEIVDEATAALELEEINAEEINMMVSYRAFASYRKYEHTSGGNPHDLESAINDFQAVTGYNRYGRVYIQALLEKSFRLKQKAPNEALVILDQALRATSSIRKASIRSKYKKQIEANRAECHLRIACEKKDVAEIVTCCERLLSAGTNPFQFAMPLSFAALELVKISEAAPVLALVKRIMLVTDAASVQKHLDNEHIVMLSARAGHLSCALGKDYSKLALEQYLRSISSGATKDLAFRYSVIGRLSLDVGKDHLSMGERETAADCFRDSIEWFERSLSFALEPTIAIHKPEITHSGLGDAYLRLQSIVGGVALGRKAIQHFKQALAIGDPPPEVESLMGEAYFRIGRYLGSARHLEKAIQLKDSVIGKQLSTRENWSVCGAAHLALYKSNQDEKHLESAVQAVVMANEADPTWPWPLIQLAHLFDAYKVPQTTLNLVSQCLSLSSHAGQSISSDLMERSLHLIVENTEFKKLVLGGRTKVFVLDDRHRLLSSSIVLKPTTKTSATKEMNNAEAFGQYVKENDLASEYKVPRPIGLVDIDETQCVYAMWREEGQTLADYYSELRDAKRHSDLEKIVYQAVRYLALYHSWDRRSSTQRAEIGSWARIVRDTVGKEIAAKVNIGNAIQQFLPSSPETLPKKDAHPENWLVSDSNELIMIDLEATSRRPIVFEVAQLVDDYGILPATEDGFQQRLRVVDKYMDEMNRFGRPTTLGENQVDRVYGLCWLLRAVFGLRLCQRHERVTSSTVQRRLRDRQLHYKDSIAFLRARFPASIIDALAVEFLT